MRSTTQHTCMHHTEQPSATVTVHLWKCIVTRHGFSACAGWKRSYSTPANGTTYYSACQRAWDGRKHRAESEKQCVQFSTSMVGLGTWYRCLPHIRAGAYATLFAPNHSLSTMLQHVVPCNANHPKRTCGNVPLERHAVCGEPQFLRVGGRRTQSSPAPAGGMR